MSLDTDLYETDGVAWAEQQAEALRRRAGHNELDYDNLAEEIEDVGKSIARAAHSHLDVVIEHLLKLELIGRPEDVRGWRASVKHARKSLNRELTPTLRARLPDELREQIEDQIEMLIGRGLLTDEQAAPRRQRPYSWEEVTTDWLPEAPESGS